jgi:hypothetical protein
VAFAETITAKDTLRMKHGLRELSMYCVRIPSLFDNQTVGYPNSEEMFYIVSVPREGERPTMSTHDTSRCRCYYLEALVCP